MRLRVISAIAIVVIVIMTSVGVFIEKLDANQEHPHTSITDVNSISTYELDRIHSLCNNPIISGNGSDTLITCPIPANVTSWIDISPPVYKKTVCHSTYGCSGKYVYIQQNQDTMISEKQQQDLENFALKNIPEAKSWPSGWELDHVEVQVRPNSVIAYMQFFIPVINPTYKNCGWYPEVNVDLETKKVSGTSLVPPSNTTCTK